MIDHNALCLAVRGRLLTVEVCTTGATTLAATATGYTRASGSFLTDGFALGMEVTASGFSTAANNGTGRITALTATVMTVGAYTLTAVATADGYTLAARTLVTEGAGAGRTIAAALPAFRAFANKSVTPIANVPYVEEDYQPGGAPRKQTLGAFGELEVNPLYVLRCHGVPNTGRSALDRLADALITHFAPGTPLTVGADTARVRTDLGPYPSGTLYTDDDRPVVTLTIPLTLRTANSR